MESEFDSWFEYQGLEKCYYRDKEKTLATFSHEQEDINMSSVIFYKTGDMVEIKSGGLMTVKILKTEPHVYEFSIRQK